MNTKSGKNNFFNLLHKAITTDLRENKTSVGGRVGSYSGKQTRPSKGKGIPNSLRGKSLPKTS